MYYSIFRKMDHTAAASSVVVKSRRNPQVSIVEQARVGLTDSEIEYLVRDLQPRSVFRTFRKRDANNPELFSPFLPIFGPTTLLPLTGT